MHMPTVSVGALLSALVVAGCAATPPVDQQTRAAAGAALGGEWTRTPQDLANPNIQSASASFDRTTGDGRMRFKAGYTNQLRLVGRSEDGGFKYFDQNTVGGGAIDYVCRAAEQLVCSGRWQGTGTTFSIRMVRVP